MKTLVIINPLSGKLNIGYRLRGLERFLQDSGFDHQIIFTSAAREAESLARKAVEEGVQSILVAGGDGTINEVINGMAGSTARLGIIPTGCRNVLARELGIPTDLGPALELIASDRVRRIDLGRANQRYFAVMIGIGLDADAVRDVETNLLNLKRFLRGYAYHLAGVRSLFKFHTSPFPVKIDREQTLFGCAAVIANGHFYGGSHQMVSSARVDDGYLDLCLFEKGGRLDYLRYFLGVLTRRHQGFSDVQIRRLTELKIERAGLPIHVDGDFAGFTPVEVRIHPRALDILAPSPGGE